MEKSEISGRFSARNFTLEQQLEVCKELMLGGQIESAID